MNPRLLPAPSRDDIPSGQHTVVAFRAEKERRSGSRRTVDGWARILWPFLNQVGSPRAVLDAASYADAHNLWIRNKAKVPVVNGPVGVHGWTGELVSWINVYRRNSGFVHGAPSID